MSVKLQEIVKNVFQGPSLHVHLLEELNSAMQRDIQAFNSLAITLLDRDILKEVEFIVNNGNEAIYFGRTLRDLKCVVHDETRLREHEIFVKYEAPKKLVVSSVNLPYSPLQDREYKTLEDIFIAYKGYINNLSSYFYELERIDCLCMVMEPKNPCLKDNYRRILLDDRIWLHVEVTHQGLATNIHLVSHSDKWHNKLQTGLLSWDHDKDIVDNIMAVFDLNEFPTISHNTSTNTINDDKHKTEAVVCGICLCEELPDNVGLPQPLCQNTTCGVYFHRNCLYQWLVTCAGSRPPAFGVATGACPTCLQPIACSENDS